MSIMYVYVYVAVSDKLLLLRGMHGLLWDQGQYSELSPPGTVWLHLPVVGCALLAT
jgi:hypothetical protein